MIVLFLFFSSLLLNFSPYRFFLFPKKSFHLSKMKRGGEREREKKKDSPIELTVLGEIRLSGYLA